MSVAHSAPLAVLTALVTVVHAGSAQPIDTKAIVEQAIAAERQDCRTYMSAHPDVAKSYGKVSPESYCACEANLLVGSVAPDELVRLMVDGQFEEKIGPRRSVTGLYCLGLLMHTP